MKIFYLRTGTKQIGPLLSLLFNISMEVLLKSIRKKERKNVDFDIL
jgi:hypothetical protein